MINSHSPVGSVMAREIRVASRPSHFDPQPVFLRPVRPTPGSSTLKTYCFLPQCLSGGNATFGSCSYVKASTNACSNVHIITPRPHITVGYNDKHVQLSRLSTRGSTPMVLRKKLAGRGDPTGDITRMSRVIRGLAGRSGLVESGSGRVES